MPKVRLADGSFVDVGLDALFADDGQTNLNIPTGPVFTSDDLERVRSEEKDKLYGRIEGLREEITGFKEQVGSLTAAEQRREAQAQEELARAEAERLRQEEQGLSAQELVDRAREEWNQTLTERESQWNSRFEEIDSARAQAEAVAQREREFNDLRDYTAGVVAANEADIAPQLLPWITGNTREEVDAAVTRAKETTAAILAEVQQNLPPAQEAFLQDQPGAPQQFVPQPPATPGTRTTIPVGADPATQFQTLTAEQISQMPMDQYAKLRGQIGIGSRSQERGLYG